MNRDANRCKVMLSTMLVILILAVPALARDNQDPGPCQRFRIVEQSIPGFFGENEGDASGASGKVEVQIAGKKHTRVRVTILRIGPFEASQGPAWNSFTLEVPKVGTLEAITVVDFDDAEPGDILHFSGFSNVHNGTGDYEGISGGFFFEGGGQRVPPFHVSIAANGRLCLPE